MFLIQSIYYQVNTASIGTSMQVANSILGAGNANIFRFTNVIEDIALNTPNLGVSNSFCNDPVVKIIRDGLTSIVGVLTALGVAVAVVGIIIGGLMRATAWGSEQRIAMSNKAISSAVLGLIIVLLGVILGTAVPTWFGLQNSTCPLSLPSSSPASGSSSSSGSSSPSTSGSSFISSSSPMASLSSMLGPSSLASIEQRTLSIANQPQALSPATPSPSVFGGTGAIAMTDLHHGFSFTVPANTTPRMLRLYVGANQAKGLFTASLHGVIRQDATLDMRHNPMSTGANALYIVYYSTNTPDQELTITYTLLDTNGSAGYILLEAATLQ